MTAIMFEFDCYDLLNIDMSILTTTLSFYSISLHAYSSYRIVGNAILLCLFPAIGIIHAFHSYIHYI